jgi:hypothetical protein
MFYIFCNKTSQSFAFKIAKEYFHEDFQVFGKQFVNIIGILFFKLQIININTSFLFLGNISIGWTK